jgi:hypothetical protein
MKVVRSSTSRTGRQEMLLVLSFTRGWFDPRAMVRSEVNMSWKNPVKPPGIDPRTVPLVAQHLNHYATSGPIDPFYSTKILHKPWKPIIDSKVQRNNCLLSPPPPPWAQYIILTDFTLDNLYHIHTTLRDEQLMNFHLWIKELILNKRHNF